MGLDDVLSSLSATSGYFDRPPSTEQKWVNGVLNRTLPEEAYMAFLKSHFPTGPPKGPIVAFLFEQAILAPNINAFTVLYKVYGKVVTEKYAPLIQRVVWEYVPMHDPKVTTPEGYEHLLKHLQHHVAIDQHSHMSREHRYSETRFAGVQSQQRWPGKGVTAVYLTDCIRHFQTYLDSIQYKYNPLHRIGARSMPHLGVNGMDLDLRANPNFRPNKEAFLKSRL